MIEYRVGAPTEQLADRLMLGTGEQVLELIRLRRVDGEPLALMRNAIPERFPPPREELAADGLYAALCRRGGRSAVAHERIGALAADVESAELVGEEPGPALLTMERESSTNDGTVIEHSHHLYRVARYSFEVILVD